MKDSTLNIRTSEDHRDDLRVCLVEFLGRGGLVHYAYQFCSGLADQGITAELITDTNYELDSRPHNFRVTKLWSLWDPRPSGPVSPENRSVQLVRRAARGAAYYKAWASLVRYLRKTRPDVVQFGDIRFAADLIPLTVLRLSGIRLADVCHNVVPFDTTGSTQVLRRSSRTTNIFRKIYGCFSLIFVHSEINRQMFNDTYGSATRIEVIPHGNESIFRTSGDKITPAVAERFGIREGSPVVLFFGNLSKYKGIEDLIASFTQVVSAVPDARLIIAGYPNPDVDVVELEKLVSRLGLGESVLIYPRYVPMEEVSAFFALARVVALPYRMIFQSGALQVAYSFGKPVVATAVGGLNEAVEDGVTGLLVPPGDHGALAEALITILTDETLAGRMGERAKLLSETKYSWDNVARIAAAAYRSVCKAAQN